MNALRVVVTVGVVLLASTVQRADAASCELMKIFSAVKPLESNTDMAACIAATGYEMLPPAGPPTDAQVAKICGLSSCISVFGVLQKMDIPDCTIDILGGLNVKQVFDGIATKCGSVSGGAAASSTPAPASTPTVTFAKPANQASQPLAVATPAPAAASAPASATTPASGKTTAAAAAAAAEPTLNPTFCE